jgi:hypothetical protein
VADHADAPEAQAAYPTILDRVDSWPKGRS